MSDAEAATFLATFGGLTVQSVNGTASASVDLVNYHMLEALLVNDRVENKTLQLGSRLGIDHHLFGELVETHPLDRF